MRASFPQTEFVSRSPVWTPLPSIALVALVGCASHQTPLVLQSLDPHTLSECERTKLQTGVIYKCRDFMLSVLRADPNMPPRPLLAMHLADLEKAVGGKFVEHPSVFTSPHNKQDAIEYSLLSRDEVERPIATGILTTIARRPEGTWMVSCIASTGLPGPETCTNLLLELVERGLPKHEMPAPSNVLAGRPLGVPPQCQALPANRIRCEGAELFWDELSARDVLQLESKVIPKFKKDLSTLGEVLGREMSCKIEDKRTECLVFEIHPKKGRQFKVVMGVAKLRKRPYVVQCAYDASFKGELPPPCNQVFRLN